MYTAEYFIIIHLIYSDASTFLLVFGALRFCTCNDEKQGVYK